MHGRATYVVIGDKKLEEELGVKLFERNAQELAMTVLGEQVVRQAQVVLEQAAQIQEIAKLGKDPLAAPLRLGVIYTIAPYVLPSLMQRVMQQTPQMPLMLYENFTVKLLELLRAGEIDCALLAEPFPDTNLAIAKLYDEPFVAAVPSTHPLAQQTQVSTASLQQETLLMLGAGHCFRDHVLQVCPEFGHLADSQINQKGLLKNFEGSSLETIKYMVAAGLGLTILPRLAVPATQGLGRLGVKANAEPHICYLPLTQVAGEPPASRRVVLAWRRSFTRYEAIAALRNAIRDCDFPQVNWLS